MKKIEGYESVVTAEELEKLPVGPQICKITEVVDKPDEEYLDIYFDVCDGKYKGHFAKLEQVNGGKKLGHAIRSYKEKALMFFKGFIVAVEKSNKGYVWNWDEKTLVGKFVVVNFGEEEYLDKDCNLKIALRAQEFRSGEKYRAGEVKPLPLRKLSAEDQDIYEKHLGKTTVSASVGTTTAPTSPTPLVDIPDDDLPF